MRVRNAAMILGSILVGAAVNNASAIPFPLPPGITENPALMIAASGPLVTYNPAGDTNHPDDGIFTVTLDDFSLVQDNQSGNVLSPATFNMTVYINRTTAALDGGSLDIEGDFGSGNEVYFYSNTVDAFGGQGNVLNGLFTQENAPGPGTDTTYAAIGQEINITIVAPQVSSAIPGPGSTITDDLDTAYGPNDVNTLAKASGEPVPEPLSTLLVGIGLSAMGLGATRRRVSR